MKKAVHLVVLVAAALALTACTDNPEPEILRPAPTPAEQSPTPIEDASYTYTLRVSCFCPDAGEPVRVTVRDGDVVEAVHAGGGGKVPKWQRLTIADIIDAADEAKADGAAEVDVQWPEGQDHPDSVYIDQDRTMADEEIGYAISNVSPLP